MMVDEGKAPCCSVGNLVFEGSRGSCFCTGFFVYLHTSISVCYGTGWLLLAALAEILAYSSEE